MKKILSLVASLAFFAVGAAQADEPVISGSNAIGVPGSIVFLELSYDYGTNASFETIIEDFSFSYPKRVLTFLPGISTIDSERDALGQPLTLTDYVLRLTEISASAGGNTIENEQPFGLPADQGGYSISFFTNGSVGHARSGLVQLRGAFEILSGAAPGDYLVTFDNDVNVLVDLDENEFYYPQALQQLQVTVQAAVVPEPEMALMLLPGLALIGLHVRRRRARQNQAA